MVSQKCRRYRAASSMPEPAFGAGGIARIAGEGIRHLGTKETAGLPSSWRASWTLAARAAGDGLTRRRPVRRRGSGARQGLIGRFPPRYANVVAHHVTLKFGDGAARPPTATEGQVVGEADDGAGASKLSWSPSAAPRTGRTMRRTTSRGRSAPGGRRGKATT